MIPPSIDYLSTGWTVCGFMLTYKQPGDWFAPVWSIWQRKGTGSKGCSLSAKPSLVLWWCRRFLLVMYIKLQSMVTLFQAFKGCRCPSFNPALLPTITIEISFSPPLTLSALFLHPVCPPLTSEFFPFYLLTHFSLWHRFLCTSRGVLKSITSSQHHLNFQLMTLRSVSPDTSITSDQPSKNQIRHKLTQAVTLTLTQPKPPVHNTLRWKKILKSFS